jgi:hypothetical protein
MRSKFVTASQTAVDALDALLPWANGEPLNAVEVRGRIMRFLSAPIGDDDLLLGLSAADGERLATGRISDSELAGLQRDLRELIVDVLETRARKSLTRLWHWPSLGYGRVIVSRDRKKVTVTWVSGGLRDLLLYTVWHLLTRPDALAVARCEAPAAGNWKQTCGKWFVKRGGRRGPSRKHCSDACRQRVFRKVEGIRRSSPRGK